MVEIQGSRQVEGRGYKRRRLVPRELLAHLALLPQYQDGVVFEGLRLLELMLALLTFVHSGP